MEPKFLTLPVFPLSLVLLPGETKVLHIFEERYIQLVEDCLKNNANFGIPFVQKSILSEFGIEVCITSVLQRFPNGEMDIEIRGVSPFRMIHFTPVLKPKLYGAASIKEDKDEMISSRNELFQLLKQFVKLTKDKNVPLESLSNASVYKVARVISLSSEEKLELISLPDLTSKESLIISKLSLLNHTIAMEKRLGNNFSLN